MSINKADCVRRCVDMMPDKFTSVDLRTRFPNTTIKSVSAQLRHFELAGELYHAGWLSVDKKKPLKLYQKLDKNTPSCVAEVVIKVAIPNQQLRKMRYNEGGWWESSSHPNYHPMPQSSWGDLIR